MKSHKAGTKFEREYNGKKVSIRVMADGSYQYGKKKYRSLTAAVKDGIGTSTPASVFFKIGGKSAAKTAKKTRKGKSQPIETAHSLSDTIKAMVKSEIENAIREEVRSAVNGAIQAEFRGEFGTTN